MSSETSQDALRRVQADLADVSARLANLSEDFRHLSQVLPAELGSVPPQPQQPQAAWGADRPGLPPQPQGPAWQAQGPAWAPPLGQPVGAPQPTGPVRAIPAVGSAPLPAGRPYAQPQTVQRPAAAAAPAKPRRQVTVAEIFSIFGSAITLIGVAFVLVLPQDGVVGTVARTVIGTVLAGAAIGTAIWQHRKDPKNIGAQALMATGVASAFLCIIAVTVLFVGPDGHGMVPELAGFGLAGLTSVGGVWIARRWKSEWLAILAILGSLLLAPYVVRQSFVWCLAFMVVMTVVTAAFQRGLAWVGLMAARIIPTSVVFLWAVADPGDSVRNNAAAVLGLAVLLAVAGLAMAIMHQAGSRGEQVASVAFMVLMAGPLMITCWQGGRAASAIACAGVGAAFAICGLAEKRLSDLVRSAAVPLGALFVAFAVLRAADGSYLEFIFFGLAACYFAVATSTRFKPVLVVAGVLAVIGILNWSPLLLTPLSVERALGHGVEHVVESLLGLAVALLAARALRAFLASHGPWLSYVTWAASVVFGSVAMVLAGTVIGERVGAPATWFQGAHAVVTVTWLLLCVILLRMGLRRSEGALVPVRLAIALAIAAVAKLFLFDLATLPDLVRAIAFLAVGVLLLVIGTWYNRQLDRVRRPMPSPAITPEAPPAAAPDVAAVGNPSGPTDSATS